MWSLNTFSVFLYLRCILLFHLSRSIANIIQHLWQTNEYTELVKWHWQGDKLSSPPHPHPPPKKTCPTVPLCLYPYGLSRNRTCICMVNRLATNSQNLEWSCMHTESSLFPGHMTTQSCKHNFLTDLMCVLPTNLSAQLGIRHSNRAHTFWCSRKAPNKWYLILLDHAIGVLWFLPWHTYCAGVQSFPLHIQHCTGNCSNIHVTFKSVRIHISLQLTYNSNNYSLQTGVQ